MSQNTSAYEQDRDAARDAARLAGQLCLAVRHEAPKAPDRLEKPGREPATIADYGSQAVILQHLAACFPADQVIAEERASEFEHLATDSQRRSVAYHVGETLGRHVSQAEIHEWLDFGKDGKSPRIWVVDPIDGTKGFLRGEQFAVAIALLINGQPVAAALACPLLPFDAGYTDTRQGVIALAIRGQGAILETLNGSRNRPLRVSPLGDIAKARVVESVEAGHTDHGFSAPLLAAAGVGGDPLRMDSQAKYAAVADGRAEVYIRNSKGSDYREKVWDHAAGALIVEEAGGTVTDLEGKPLDFSKGTHLAANWGILATSGHFHNLLLDAIRAQA